MNKYNAVSLEYDGHKFASQKEFGRYLQLDQLQKSGRIFDLKCQVPFLLIPAQREPDKIGPRGGVKQGKVLEKSCTYIAGFAYKQDGKTVVEDVKGYKTDVYILKRKLMLWVHGIRIREV